MGIIKVDLDRGQTMGHTKRTLTASPTTHLKLNKGSRPLYSKGEDYGPL